MLGSILGIFQAFTGIGSAIKAISNDIAAAKIAALQSKEGHARLEAEERVRTLEARRDVLIAESSSGSRLNQFVRAALAWPIIIILWKVFIWDYAFHELTKGTTPMLSEWMWGVVIAVIGFYFVTERFRR